MTSQAARARLPFLHVRVPEDGVEIARAGRDVGANRAESDRRNSDKWGF